MLPVAVGHHLQGRFIVGLALLETFNQQLTLLLAAKSNQRQSLQRQRCLQVWRLFQHFLHLLKGFFIVADIDGIWEKTRIDGSLADSEEVKNFWEKFKIAAQTERN